MDRKPKNDDGQTKTKRKEVAKSNQGHSDDCSQIDSIIGSFGKYQFLIFLFKILIGITSGFNNLGVTFYAPSDFVSYWCVDSEPPQFALNGRNYSTTLGYEPNISSLALHSLMGSNNLSQQLYPTPTPLSSSSSSSSQHVHLVGQTHQYSTTTLAANTNTKNAWTFGQLLNDLISNEERSQRRASADFNSDTPRNLRKECTYAPPTGHNERRHKCTAYKYDTGIWISTIIDEWDLVCDRSVYISISQSLYMAGFIVSFLVFGYISDRFGRWRSLLLGALIEIFSGFGCAFSRSVGQFMLFRFLLGIGCAGRSSSSYLTMIEWTGQSWRVYISTLGSLGWVVSYCAMPWIAMYFLHFRHLQLLVCFYELTLVAWLLTLPESPRWLLTHKRFDDAYQALLKAAKFNGLIKPGGGTPGSSSNSSSNKSSNESLAELQKSASLLKPASGVMVALRKFDPSGNPIQAAADGGSFARKRLNSISMVSAQKISLAIGQHRSNESHHINNHNNNQEQQSNKPTQQSLTPLAAHESTIILAPDTEVATHVEVPLGGSVAGSANASGQHGDGAPAKGDQLQPYTMEEFDRKFAQLAEAVSQKEFSKNEDRLSFVDLFRWKNLRSYTLILAFIWGCNSFIYYGIALRVGDFGGKNLFVSFSLAGATELPGILFTLVFMKLLPRKTTNILMFSAIFLICALQAPLKYYELGWLQQTSMILAKLFNSCSFICILYQTMELFPTSIRQTAYSSCSLASRIGSILAPFIKELSQMTNTLVPPVMFAVLSLMEIVLMRRLPETKGSDLPDTLLEAEKFKGTLAKGSGRGGLGRKLCNGA
uniref:Solute carrier family 22 member 6 n=1 Tax=Aceria tosichella TaxID=561515 RepID=A0A6G1S9I1_9ACAR